MSNLKDVWTDKTDGESDILAEDINSVANSAIESEENIVLLGDRVTALEDRLGDVSTVLDEIIAAEEGYIGG